MIVAIEIGGTFTDYILVKDNGEYIEGKVHSTPDAPWIAAINALNVLFKDFTVNGKQIKEILHGSTVATNAVIQRKGPLVGLLITEGFRDVPFIQRQHRGKDLYNWKFKKAEPIVSRSAVCEIRERVSKKGNIQIKIDENETLKRIDAFLKRKSDITSLAISFLHSYINPSNEKHVRNLIRREYPNLNVCISSEIIPQFREYERTSTILLTAFMKPIVEEYLFLIEKKIKEEGIEAEIFVCRSSGGVLPISAIAKYPAEMLLSGPSAGVSGARHISKICSIDNVLTVDMGGTSTDVSLITSGNPEISTENAVDKLPLAMPMIDIVAVGAGGGSIAWLDGGGMMRLGPQSSGANPGPACYDNGGKEPTITDALLLNGLIRTEKFIGGKVKLSVEKAKEAMKHLAEKLGNSEYEIAEKIYKIAISNVAQAMRIVTIERGYDPRDYVLCAYGGAGPLFAANLAKEMGLKQCIIPISPGTFSAWGLLVSDYQRDYSKTLLSKLADLNYEKIEKVFNFLKKEAIAEFKQHKIPVDNLFLNFSADLRYIGQQYELNVPITLKELKNQGIELMIKDFNEIHKQRYGHNAPEEEVEIVTFRLSSINHRKEIALDRAISRNDKISKDEEIKISKIFHQGNFIDCRFGSRSDLREDFWEAGPIVLEEDTATTFVPPGFSVRIGQFNNLFIEELK
jgi:N-methylhydantoinase A